jgi:hypothetical protein
MSCARFTGRNEEECHDLGATSKGPGDGFVSPVPEVRISTDGFSLRVLSGADTRTARGKASDCTFGRCHRDGPIAPTDIKAIDIAH